MCPAAQAKRGAVSDSTSGPKLRQGKVGGVRGRSVVSHFLSAFHYILSDGAGAHVRWIFIVYFLGLIFLVLNLHVCVCVLRHVHSWMCPLAALLQPSGFSPWLVMKCSCHTPQMPLQKDQTQNSPNSVPASPHSVFSRAQFLPVRLGWSQSEMWITTILSTLKIWWDVTVRLFKAKLKSGLKSLWFETVHCLKNHF